MMYIIAIIIFLVLVFGIGDKKNEHNYTAEFGDPNDYLGRWNHGFCVTGSKSLTKKASFENCALFGPTGSGKTSQIILPSLQSLARGKSSIIINDPSSELYTKASTYLAKKGYKILRLDFSNSKKSESYNPLLECKTIADIQKVCLLIVRNAIGESSGDKFWEQSSIMLISLFSRYLIFHQEAEFRTLQNVLRLVEKFAVDGAVIDKMFAKTNDEELLSSYKATIVLGDKTLQSVIASTRTALTLFCDAEVCKVTATNSIDFNLLRKEPTAIFICNPLQDLMYYKPLSALFIQSVFNFILSRIPNKNERAIFFVIDEAATMKFPSLSLTVSNIRKHLGSILLCQQDEMSLIAQYGQAEAHQIKTNCGCHIFLKGSPQHTAKELSQILGKYTFKDEKGNDKSRELMTADEVRLTDDAIILIGNKPPLKCKTVPYFKKLSLMHLDRLLPYELPLRNVESPSLVSFY
jgi:type IV secretion system protein VirD4